MAKHSPYLFVHAGVVSFRNRAIVIPGLSFAGKSTLVRELVRQGCVYYSDEYAVLDEHGQVHSYLKPLSLRAPNTSTRQVPLKELGGGHPRLPIPVRLIVSARYCRDAAWRPLPMSEAQSMLVLMENTVMARSRPQDTMRRLSAAVRNTTALVGERGDAETCAAEILSQVSSARAERFA
ncbi:MAG: hypothetical protein ABI811_06290 [Acidobacteriota bacterium]